MDQPRSRRFRTIQPYPKDLRVLPGHPDPAVSWHSGFRGGAGEEPMLDLKRRQFLTLLGCAPAAWPLAAHAQQPNRVRHIGILADEGWPPIDRLKQGLRMLGYVEGQNLEIVYRFAAGQAERYP